MGPVSTHTCASKKHRWTPSFLSSPNSLCRGIRSKAFLKSVKNEKRRFCCFCGWKSTCGQPGHVTNSLSTIFLFALRYTGYMKKDFCFLSCFDLSLHNSNFCTWSVVYILLTKFRYVLTFVILRSPLNYNL